MKQKTRLDLEKLSKMLENVSHREFYSIIGGSDGGFTGYCVFDYYEYLSAEGFDRNESSSFDTSFYYSAFQQYHKDQNNGVMPSNLIPDGTGSIAGPTADQVGAFNVNFFDTISIDGNDGSTGSSGSSGSGNPIGTSLSTILSDSDNKVMMNYDGHAYDLQSITEIPSTGGGGATGEYFVTLYDPKTGGERHEILNSSSFVGNVEAFRKPSFN